MSLPADLDVGPVRLGLGVAGGVVRVREEVGSRIAAIFPDQSGGVHVVPERRRDLVVDARHGQPVAAVTSMRRQARVIGHDAVAIDALGDPPAVRPRAKQASARQGRHR